MEDFTVSRTALATAMMRAIHTRTDPHPLIDDLWGDRLVPDAVRDQFRKLALSRMDVKARAKALVSPETVVDDFLAASSAYENVILRERYTEDALRASVGQGVRQYVILGAGFDSFSIRRPIGEIDLAVFEIDHPATQSLKLKCLQECGICLPSSIEFIAADLSTTNVSTVLRRSSFRADVPAFVAWLGVTMYLTREANASTMRSIAKSCAPGSQFVFTYIDDVLFTSDDAAFRELRDIVASLGEPFRSGLDPATLAEMLRDCGLTLLEDLADPQLAARYDRTDLARAPIARCLHIALARVGV